MNVFLRMTVAICMLAALFSYSYAQESSPIYFVSLSQDETLVAASARDGTVTIEDAVSGEVIRRLTGHTAVATAIWSESGKQLATISSDLTARVWDVSSGKQTHIFRRFGLTDAIWLNETDIYLTVEESSGIVWDLVTGDTRNVSYGGWVFSFSPSRDRIAAGRRSGIAILDAKSLEKLVVYWDYYDDTGKLLQAVGDDIPNIDGRFRPILSIEWHPNGELIATGDWSGYVKLREAASGRIIYDLNATDSPRVVQTGRYVIDLAFSRDGTQLYSITQGGTIRTWDISSGKLVSDKQTKNLINSAVFSKRLDQVFSVQHSFVRFDEIRGAIYESIGVSRISLKP